MGRYILRHFGYFGPIYQHSAPAFGSVGSLSMFSINQPLFLQKTKILRYFLKEISIVDLDLALGYKELGTYYIFSHHAK